MITFTFFKIRPGKAIDDFEIEAFDRPAAAKAHAESLLVRDHYEAIEIWDGETTVRIVPDVSPPS